MESKSQESLSGVLPSNASKREFVHEVQDIYIRIHSQKSLAGTLSEVSLRSLSQESLSGVSLRGLSQEFLSGVALRSLSPRDRSRSESMSNVSVAFPGKALPKALFSTSSKNR